MDRTTFIPPIPPAHKRPTKIMEPKVPTTKAQSETAQLSAAINSKSQEAITEEMMRILLLPHL